MGFPRGETGYGDKCSGILLISLRHDVIKIIHGRLYMAGRLPRLRDAISGT